MTTHRMDNVSHRRRPPRSRPHTHGADLLGQIARHDGTYRDCHHRGPEGIIIEMAEQLS